MRFTIRAIIVVVVVVALSVAALRYASELTASLTFTTTSLMLGVAVLGAVICTGRSRAFWFGFAAFGLGYVALVFGPWASEAVRPHLATSQLLEYAGPRIERNPQGSQQQLVGYTSPGTTLNRINFTLSNSTRQGATFSSVAFVPIASESFLRVGHSLSALLVGLVGGVIARYFFQRSYPLRTEPASDGRPRAER